VNNAETRVLEMILGGLDDSEKEYFRGLRVLVTGCAGFLGSWLVDALLSLGASVTCVDNLSTGSYRNIERHLGKGSFSFIKADVSSVELEGVKYDLAFHGAAVPAPDMYMARPVEAMMPDSFGLYRVLSAARNNRSRVVFLSSSEVYGDAEVIPTPESYPGRVSPTGPRSPYDEGKRFGEALSMAFYREYGVDVRIARIFNTYGPRLDPGAPYSRVISRFVERALKGKPLEIHGDGLQTRSFTFVSDTVAALLKIGSCGKCSGEVFNVGSDVETSIIELARLVLELTGSRSPIVYTEPRPHDPRRRRPDIAKISRYVGWRPRTPLLEGLRLTIEWYKEVLGVG